MRILRIRIPNTGTQVEDKSNDIKNRGSLYLCLFLVMANQSNQLRLPAVGAKFTDLVPRIGE